MPSKHAKLGPSSAHRWLHCTPSAGLESGFPNRSTKYADEGTLAHSIVEERLQRVIKGKPRGKTSAKYQKNELYFPGMDDFCDEYVTYVSDCFDKLKTEGKEPVMFSERQVDFSDWVPEGFGTTDTVIIADGTMYVYDFKFGSGVRVSAIGNPQLRLYALGAYNEFSLLYDFDNVVMTIVQPRVENGISSEEITCEDLLHWADEEIRPKAEMAYEGAGACVEGDWCKFCRAKVVCPAKNASFLAYLKEMVNPPKLLTPEDLARLLPIAEYMTGWVKDLKDYMFDQALNKDVHYPGYKLVEGRANRVILNPDAVAEKLMKAGYKYTDIYTLKGIGALEDVCGVAKFAEIVGNLVEKPAGKPTLVADSDPRPAIGEGGKMFDDNYDDEKGEFKNE